MSNLAYMEKKARGRLTAPACLSTCFKMVSAFFRGEPLGYPWEGGWSSEASIVNITGQGVVMSDRS